MARAGISPEWEALLRLLPGYDPFRSPGDSWFEPDRAERAIGFIHDCIRHVEGDLAGQAFRLQPWQQSIVANLFGWQRLDKQGRQVRRYREALLYVPRKNGKTPLAAAISLLVFFCDGERGMQGYIAAGDREQAALLFRQCKGMVEQEEELSSRCRIYGGAGSAGQSRSIVRESDGSFLRVVSADADTKHGGNTHLAVIDELHVQPNRDLVDVLRTSMASANRKQPLLIYITTADFDRPSICNEVHDYAVKVRDGVVDDPTFLPAVFETTDKDDWTAPEVWRRANPNLGVSVSEEYIAREVEKAKDNPAYENTVKRLHLNMRTANDVKAFDMARWDACSRPLVLEDLAGRSCYGGLDLASTTDLAALVLVFPIEDAYALLCRFWVPREGARRRERTDRVPYLAWAAQGHITLTDGDVIDYDVIRRDIGELDKLYEIRKLAVDRWNSTQLVTQLQGDAVPIDLFGQGFASMTAPTKELLALVVSGRLIHGGNPVLRWCASNTATESDAAGNLKPSKKKSTEKIDGVVASIMALGVALVSGDSIYDSSEIFSL